MTNQDDEPGARLSAADQAFLADLENGQGFFSQLGLTFKGPLGWIGVSVLIAALIFVGLAIWFGWEAFRASSVKLVVLWATGALAAILGNGLLRLFLFSRMNHLMIMRELKRIELRLAKLDDRLV